MIKSPRKKPNDTTKFEKPQDDEEKKMTNVLKNPVNRKFALENLIKIKSDIKEDRGQVKLPAKVFDQLSEFSLKLLKSNQKGIFKIGGVMQQD